MWYLLETDINGDNKMNKCKSIHGNGTWWNRVPEGIYRSKVISKLNCNGQGRSHNQTNVLSDLGMPKNP